MDVHLTINDAFLTAQSKLWQLSSVVGRGFGVTNFSPFSPSYFSSGQSTIWSAE